MTYNGTDVVWAAPTPGSGSPTGAAGGDLAGSYPNPTIAANTINSAKIADLTVQSGDIAANAIITSKINSNAVSTGKLATSAVTEDKLDAGAVATAKIQDGAVTPIKINSTGASNGNVLTFNGTAVVWAAPASSSVPTILSGGGSITFPSVSAGSSANSDQTIGVTNAAVGDAVSLGVPNSAMAPAGLTYQAWVETNGQIRVRVTNISSASVASTTTSGTFQVRIIK